MTTDKRHTLYSLPHGYAALLTTTLTPQGLAASVALLDKDGRPVATTDGDPTIYFDRCRPYMAAREVERATQCGTADHALAVRLRDWHPCECEPGDQCY